MKLPCCIKQLFSYVANFLLVLLKLLTHFPGALLRSLFNFIDHSQTLISKNKRFLLTRSNKAQKNIKIRVPYKYKHLPSLLAANTNLSR